MAHVRQATLVATAKGVGWVVLLVAVVSVVSAVAMTLGTTPPLALRGGDFHPEPVCGESFWAVTDGGTARVDIRVPYGSIAWEEGALPPGGPLPHDDYALRLLTGRRLADGTCGRPGLLGHRVDRVWWPVGGRIEVLRGLPTPEVAIHDLVVVSEGGDRIVLGDLRITNPSFGVSWE